MNKSESIKDLAAALAKAQALIKSAKKDSTNPYFSSQYADLTSVWDACREALTANGLAVVQTTDDAKAPECVTVITTLMHSSGEWIEGRLTMKPIKADPQGVGSSITYARRYALAAIAGVAPEDDDANEASAPARQATHQPGAPNPISLKRQIREVVAQRGITWPDVSKITGIEGVLQLDDPEKLVQVLEALKAG